MNIINVKKTTYNMVENLNLKLWYLSASSIFSNFNVAILYFITKDLYNYYQNQFNYNLILAFGILYYIYYIGFILKLACCWIHRYKYQEDNVEIQNLIFRRKFNKIFESKYYKVFNKINTTSICLLSCWITNIFLKHKYDEMYASYLTVSIYLFTILGIFGLILLIILPAAICYRNHTINREEIENIYANIQRIEDLLNNIENRRRNNINNSNIISIVNNLIPVKKSQSQLCQICQEEKNNLVYPSFPLSIENTEEYCNSNKHLTCKECMNKYLNFCKDIGEIPKCPQCRKLYYFDSD